nr:MAG TPA: hypothetical protein [Caudoviricetes sp.]
MNCTKFIKLTFNSSLFRHSVTRKNIKIWE